MSDQPEVDIDALESELWDDYENWILDLRSLVRDQPQLKSIAMEKVREVQAVIDACFEYVN